MPGRKDIALSKDDMAVVRSLRHLMLTNKYERPFQPYLGAGITKLLFDPIGPATSAALSDEIRTLIKNHEPRVNLISVNVLPLYDQNAYGATLTFYIANKTEPVQISLVLERTR